MVDFKSQSDEFREYLRELIDNDNVVFYDSDAECDFYHICTSGVHGPKRIVGVVGKTYSIKFKAQVGRSEDLVHDFFT